VNQLKTIINNQQLLTIYQLVMLNLISFLIVFLMVSCKQEAKHQVNVSYTGALKNMMYGGDISKKILKDNISEKQIYMHFKTEDSPLAGYADEIASKGAITFKLPKE